MKKFFRAILLVTLTLAICLASAACTKTPDGEETTTAKAETQAQEQTTLPVAAQTDTTETETTLPAEEDSSEAENKTPETAEEIVEYFNTCANKVKTEAVKVVKNFEKRKVGDLKAPKAIEGMGQSLTETFLGDDNDPIVYGTKEEIRTNYIVPDKDYVSRLTAGDVVTATCKDNGKTYEIYFKLKNEKNPVSGKGVGSVCDVIEAHDVAKKAPAFVKELSTNYTNCEVTATIDKETGRMIHAVYSTPVALNVIVDMFGTHEITANFTYIKDFSITY